MDTKQIIELIEAVSKSGLGEFEYNQGNVKLSLKAKVQAVTVAATATTEMPISPVVVNSAQLPVQMSSEVINSETASDAASNEAVDTIKSPLIGTFYSAPAEGEEPFVKVGDMIKKGQIIGIVETMKLMNEVESDKDGVVTAILIENEQVVEFGQPLVAVK